MVELFDWNQIEQAKSLGVGRIDVASIEPFQATAQTVKLATKRGEKGEIRLRLVFQPGIIAKSRKPTSTLTTIGGLPVSAGKGVLQGVAGVFKHRENNGHQDAAAAAAGASVASPTAIAVLEAARRSTTSLASLENGVAAAAAAGTTMTTTVQEPGTLQVTVLGAKDLSHGDVKPYVTIRVGDKEAKTKHTQKTHAPEW